MRTFQLGSILISFLMLISCQQGSSENTKTLDSLGNDVTSNAPDARTKKAQGYILPGLDHGFEQSPININSKSAKDGKSHKITLFYNDSLNEIENLGHTVQLDFQAGNTVTVDDTTFNFKQCHFHTPSEHLIDGETFPMEMHIVNIMPSVNPNDPPQYLVFAILFKEGNENKFIADFLTKIPKGDNTKEELKAGTVKLADLFTSLNSQFTGHFFEYRGSLTTPPYTETVRWYIVKKIYEASAEQIEAINKIEGNNARHVKALYGREVTSN